MKKRYQNWQKRNRSNSLIFTLDVYSNNLISLMSIPYDFSRRSTVQSTRTTSKISTMHNTLFNPRNDTMHAPYLAYMYIPCTLATWISLSLSLSLLLLRPAIRDNTSSNHVFSTELLNWSIDCSRRHFLLKYLF